MQHIIVSVFDSAAQSFARPFTMPTEGMARRSFTDEVNRLDSSNPLSQHPEDYTLYQLAVFDDSTGEFVNCRKLLCTAKEVLIQGSIV